MGKTHLARLPEFEFRFCHLLVNITMSILLNSLCLSVGCKMRIMKMSSLFDFSED